MEKHLTVKEAAVALRLHPNTVYRLLNGPEPRLRSVRVGPHGGALRIAESDLEAYVNGLGAEGAVVGPGRPAARKLV